MSNGESEKKYPSDPRTFWHQLIDLNEDTFPFRDYEGPVLEWFQELVDDLKKIGIIVDKDSKLLEVGSGNGNFVRAVRNAGYDIVGVDARPRHDATTPAVAARIERLPFKDQTFDLVYAYKVFDQAVYHQNQEAMVAEVERVLKPGGIFEVGALSLDINPSSNMERVVIPNKEDRHPYLYRKKT